MTPEQKIDNVFFFLKDRFSTGESYNANYLWNLFVNRAIENGITNRTMYDEILTKLVDDRFVRKIESAPPVYHITFEGLVFEGYHHRKEVLKSNEENIKELRDQQMNLSRQMAFLTLLIAVGTLLTAAKDIVACLPFWLSFYLVVSINIAVLIIYLLIKEIKAKKMNT